MQKILITGSAGFIGFHLARHLLAAGHRVHGYDGMTPYYDVTLKENRHAILHAMPGFTATQALVEDAATLDRIGADFAPDVIIHLAAQAGVRYSLTHPRSYIETNFTGSFNVLELAKRQKVKHLLIASTSSVYGANPDMPFHETDRTDHPLTVYAATKKAVEALSHSYAHLWDLPVTLFRFFTVYGEWGRPDLAYFKFAKAILQGEPIDVYNHGALWRDFTAVEDLVEGVSRLIPLAPPMPAERGVPVEGDSLSPVAPHRIVNVGNSDKVHLMEFIGTLETLLGRKAICNFLPMQPGDVPATWADCSLLERLTGFKPETDLATGLGRFVDWYRGYYRV
ncbi:MAG: SDR family NAD(P)-dependent oxidoreductase [Tabrizicola sp.]|uniref:SDR family NAD(P)-dependent oxidoreductase n=1 Tax=Tabrizicola sp. TaxID=2005166 RepID=UPI002ABA5CF1|nr:SDR family NAD(P)-dependent oxidoreductase [Tabrizicola sp.]MDZ4088789.1 SDR family NAD(P)-dependent oxidoreductase [Tabrizicola sp.]